MCCEICLRYTSCEEEGHLSDRCCVSCPEYVSCREKPGAKMKVGGEPDDEFSDV